MFSALLFFLVKQQTVIRADPCSGGALGASPPQGEGCQLPVFPAPGSHHTWLSKDPCWRVWRTRAGDVEMKHTENWFVEAVSIGGSVIPGQSEM